MVRVGISRVRVFIDGDVLTHCFVVLFLFFMVPGMTTWLDRFHQTDLMWLEKLREEEEGSKKKL